MGGMEDTFASDNMFTGDQMNSFSATPDDGQDFQEIFKVLGELEDDSNMFGTIDNPELDQDTLPSPSKQDENDAKMAEFEKKKKEAIADVKRYRFYFKFC